MNRTKLGMQLSPYHSVNEQSLRITNNTYLPSQLQAIIPVRFQSCHLHNMFIIVNNKSSEKSYVTNRKYFALLW